MTSVKKYILLILFTILFFIGKNDVIAATPRATIKDGDYTITCVYHNGMTITVTKNMISLLQATTAVGNDNSENLQLFLLSNQVNTRDPDTGKITSYKTGGFLKDYKCPTKLYAYYVEDGAFDKIDTSKTTAALLEDVDNYLFSTSEDVGTDETGEDDGWFSDSELIERDEDTAKRDTYLISESADLLSSKEVTICDYKAYIEGEEGATSAATLSLYLFDNITFASLGNYITPLDFENEFKDEPRDVALKSCPNRGDVESLLYINSPQPDTSIGNNAPNVLTSYTSSIRYYISNDEDSCRDNNDSQACSAFVFLGERHGGSEDSEGRLCERLGGELVAIIQEIVGIMQIVVPGLVIVLTGIDIGKLVVNGNLDEELPKKKKTIIIRFIVMIIFLFLPFITDVIIGLLKDAGLIGIEYVECIFR